MGIYVLILLVWLGLGYFLYVEGERREIGGTVAFLIGILFSPFVGFIVVALSKPLHLSSSEKEEYHINSDIVNSIIADELVKLKNKRDEGIISEVEYEILKSKLLK